MSFVGVVENSKSYQSTYFISNLSSFSGGRTNHVEWKTQKFIFQRKKKKKNHFPDVLLHLYPIWLFLCVCHVDKKKI